MKRIYKEKNLSFSKKERKKAKRKIKKELGFIYGNKDKNFKVDLHSGEKIRQEQVNHFLNQRGPLVVEKRNEVRLDLESSSKEEAILFSAVLLSVLTYDSKFAKPLMSHVRKLDYLKNQIFILNNKICRYTLKLDENGHNNYLHDIDHTLPHLHYYFSQRDAKNIFNKKFIKGHIFWDNNKEITNYKN